MEPVVIAKLCRLRFREQSLTSENSSGKQVVVVDDGKLPGPWGGRISREEWIARTSTGCEVCGRAFGVQEADDIIWNPAGTAAHCGNCASYTVDADGTIVMH